MASVYINKMARTSNVQALCSKPEPKNERTTHFVSFYETPAQLHSRVARVSLPIRSHAETGLGRHSISIVEAVGTILLATQSVQPLNVSSGKRHPLFPGTQPGTD